MCLCSRCQDATWPPEPDCCPRCDSVIAYREQEKQAAHDTQKRAESHPEGAPWTP